MFFENKIFIVETKEPYSITELNRVRFLLTNHIC